MDKKNFRWTEEAENAFNKLKIALTELPTLTSLIPGEVLTIYLETSKIVADAILVANREDRQMPIYFVSHILQGAEVGYSDMEKLELPLVNIARRLRRYFLAYTIEGLINIPLRQVLLKPEKSGKSVK